MNEDLSRLQDQLRHFAEERDWDQFHSPKNLASALVVEAGELLERFQWLTEDQSQNLTQEQHAKVADEVADVFLYAIRLADKLGIDLVEVAKNKIARNAEKYPVDKARGNAKKYTEL
jgi:dCTP diphosphatase